MSIVTGASGWLRKRPPLPPLSPLAPN